jgi:retron-type reverse transcriptase
VRHHKYIYEFDIEGFFNNVGIRDTIAKLRERGMSELRFDLKNILESCPNNIKET